MNFYSFINDIYSFLHSHVIIAIIIAIILLFVLYRSPKIFFIILMIVILLTGIFYIITDVAFVGKHQKGKMIKEHDLE